VVIAIGCLIKGETPHFEYLSDATTHALMQISLNPQTPVVFGVLTCWNQEQAWARAQGADNLGISWAKTAIELGQT
ncbi:MAG: 6,7-dimethyl-8-ribityllumazine synthase, partial [Candidatus Paceibacteria bacterium]